MAALLLLTLAHHFVDLGLAQGSGLGDRGLLRLLDRLLLGRFGLRLDSCLRGDRLLDGHRLLGDGVGACLGRVPNFRRDLLDGRTDLGFELGGVERLIEVLLAGESLLEGIQRLQLILEGVGLLLRGDRVRGLGGGSRFGLLLATGARFRRLGIFSLLGRLSIEILLEKALRMMSGHLRGQRQLAGRLRDRCLFGGWRRCRSGTLLRLLRCLEFHGGRRLRDLDGLSVRLLLYALVRRC